MTAASNNEIYDRLGQLGATMESVDKQLIAIRADMESSEHKSETSRANMNRRVDEIASRTGSLESDMKAVKEDLTTVKTVTEDVTRWREMGMGALAVTGIAAGSLASLVAYYWSEIIRVFRA